MTVPTNGITADVFRESMPPYHLSTDLLDAMFAATPAPPPGASIAWREERATRLIHEMAGMMPADAPQARIAAQIVIVREAADHTFALAEAPGLALEHVSRLMRTGAALSTAGVVLERSLVRHQQKPVPFFGTVLAEGIDVAAIAGRWGAARVRPVGGGVLAGEELRSAPGTAPSPQPPPTRGGGESAPSDACPDAERDGGSTDGLVRMGMAGSTLGSSAQGQGLPAMTVNSDPCVTINSDPAATMEARPAAAAETRPPPGSAQGVEASAGVVTRLREGPGWTVDVVRPRNVGDAVGGVLAGGAGGGSAPIGAAPERGA